MTNNKFHRIKRLSQACWLIVSKVHQFTGPSTANTTDFVTRNEAFYGFKSDVYIWLCVWNHMLLPFYFVLCLAANILNKSPIKNETFAIECCKSCFSPRIIVKVKFVKWLFLQVMGWIKICKRYLREQILLF